MRSSFPPVFWGDRSEFDKTTQVSQLLLWNSRLGVDHDDDDDDDVDDDDDDDVDDDDDDEKDHCVNYPTDSVA